jgi:hypothetical protein
MSSTTALNFRQLWEEALPWNRFLNPEMDRFSLWDGIACRVKLPDWAVALAAKTTVRRYLVLAEDWCGDAANTVPVLAGLAAAVPGGELRVLPRDDYLEVMDRYLTNGSRSIPIVIGLDDDFAEVGHWGPRPTELQAWVMANKETMPKDERYAEVRRWYARDRGETTLREVLDALKIPTRSPSRS